MRVLPATMFLPPCFRPVLLGLALCVPTLCSVSLPAQMPMPPMESGGGATGEVPQFDVISVKPHKAGDDMMMVHWGDADYTAKNMDLKNIISSVYGVKSWLVFGLPPWAESARWDIDAKVSAPDPKVMHMLTNDQRRQMIAGILKDRFGLVEHQETKVQPVFVMTVLPEGAKLTQSPPLPPATDGDPKKPRGGMWRIGRGTLDATRMTMSNLAENLSYQVERIIVDKTGLTGEYDLTLKWTPEDSANAGADNGTGDAPPAIFEALKEQLGLKLTADKAPVPTVVVDKIVQPDAD